MVLATARAGNRPSAPDPKLETGVRVQASPAAIDGRWYGGGRANKGESPTHVFW